ncbi:hypothetical protein HPB50_010993 [Hyalomma asiaticum]|uniref:Uncharacterized protein n=1 Tax=Hyalomma asiaticum TaxID=266040 RepID=A0ACB7TDB3_HYAAI|nr:hypothetical protein HPB50_010993 [Hyalomma asiaticum]
MSTEEPTNVPPRHIARHFQPLACLRSASERGRRNHPPRREQVATVPATPHATHQTKDPRPSEQAGSDSESSSAPTDSLLNAESFLANFVLPDSPLPPAREAKEAAAANVSTPPTTGDSLDLPLPPPEGADEAAAAVLTTPAPSRHDSPPPVPEITGTPRELVFQPDVRNMPDQRESDGTNPSFSPAPSSPSTSSDVSANQLISAAPVNTTPECTSSPRRSARSPSQPRGNRKEARCPSQIGQLSHPGYGHRRLEHPTPGLEIQKYVADHSRNPLPVVWAKVS